MTAAAPQLGDEGSSDAAAAAIAVQSSRLHMQQHAEHTSQSTWHLDEAERARRERIEAMATYHCVACEQQPPPTSVSGGQAAGAVVGDGWASGGDVPAAVKVPTEREPEPEPELGPAPRLGGGAE